MKYTINLNCDLGEGGAFDEKLMSFISECNIACGGHFGGNQSMNKTLQLAQQFNVKAGAHPSYPDLKNFGRKSMNISLKELKKTLKQQILRLQQIAAKQGISLHHVKPHGALYNDIVSKEEKAKIVIETIREIDSSLALFVPPKSVIKELAEGKLKLSTEAFADRNYSNDFSLVSRTQENALLTKQEEILSRVVNVAKNKTVKSVDGKLLQANFNTVCLHSDTQNAVEIVNYLAEKLPEHKVEIV